MLNYVIPKTNYNKNKKTKLQIAGFLKLDLTRFMVGHLSQSTYIKTDKHL